MSVSSQIDELTMDNPIDDKLKQRWRSIEQMDNVFRYKLQVEEKKVLPGKYQFFVEVSVRKKIEINTKSFNIAETIQKYSLFFSQYNPFRTTLRRRPQKLTSLLPTFNENEFNFNKINEKEILFNVKLNYSHRTATVTFLINNSPLTKYHTLLVPRLKENLPQLLTQESLAFAIQLLHNLKDTHFGIGYNSPGALASVNHLHLHLLYIEQHLFIEDVVRTSKLIIKFHYFYPSICLSFHLYRSSSFL